MEQVRDTKSTGGSAAIGSSATVVKGPLVNTKKIAVIGDALLSTGFALSGIKATLKASTGEEAEAAIKSLVNDSEIGIIVIARKLVDKITDRRTLLLIDSSIMPMFVPVPSYNEGEGEDPLRHLIIRAIGIDIAR